MQEATFNEFDLVRLKRSWAVTRLGCGHRWGEAGVSLVEVMITLAILVTLSSAFASTMRNNASHFRWERGAREVVETLRAARQIAIATNRNAIVTFNPAGAQVAGHPSLSVELPTGVSFSDFPGMDAGGGGEGDVIFTPWSTCVMIGGLQLAYTDPDGHERTKDITVVRATGRVLVR